MSTIENGYVCGIVKNKGEIMKLGIIICTHKSTGKEIKNSAEMIAGPTSNIEVIEFFDHNSPEELTEKYKEAIERLNSDSIVFLVDLKGGTPFNCAARLKIENPAYEVITGVNIPMVLSIGLAGETDNLDQLINDTIAETKESIERLAF